MRLTPTLPGIYVIYESFGIILYDYFVQLYQNQCKDQHGIGLAKN